MSERDYAAELDRLDAQRERGEITAGQWEVQRRDVLAEMDAGAPKSGMRKAAEVLVTLGIVVVIILVIVQIAS